MALRRREPIRAPGAAMAGRSTTLRTSVPRTASPCASTPRCSPSRSRSSGSRSPASRCRRIARSPSSSARLCDVWPDGESSLITRGVLNLTHRDGDEEPEDLVPGRRYVVEVKLNSIGYSVPPGHRLRLAVSPTYWPWVWPSPEPVLLSLYAGGSSALELPVWTGGPGAHQPPPHFAEPEEAAAPPHEASGDEDAARAIRRDVASGLVDIEGGGEHHLRLLDDGLEYHSSARNLHRVVEGQPLSAFNECEQEISISRGEWRTRVHTLSTMSSTAEDFQLTNLVEGYEGDCRVFAKTWELAVPRDHV